MGIYYGLIIPRSYNDYINKSQPAEFKKAMENTGLIPATASEENQLADKNFVNSTVGTNTANYIYKTESGGEKVPFSSIAELEAYTGTVTNNDYAFVTGTDENGNIYFDRYKANVDGDVVTWAKEYRLNNSSFTAEQWAAIESGITSELVEKFNEAAVPAVDEVKAGEMAPVTSNAVNGALADLTKLNVIAKTDANECILEAKGQGNFYVQNGGSNLPNNTVTHWYIVTVAQDRNAQKQIAYSTHFDEMYIRKYLSYQFGNWQKLVTESELKKTYNTTEIQISSDMNTNEFKNYILSHIAEWNNGDMIIITNTNQNRVVNLRLDKQTNQYFNILVTNYYMNRPCYMRYIGSSWIYNEL